MTNKVVFLIKEIDTVYSIKIVSNNPVFSPRKFEHTHQCCYLKNSQKNRQKSGETYQNLYNYLYIYS